MTATQITPKLKCRVCGSGYEPADAHILAETEPHDKFATRDSFKFFATLTAAPGLADQQRAVQH